MDTLELLRRRRSCRKFTGEVPPKETIDVLLETTLHAPSSKNCRSSRFIVVRDRALLERLSTMRDSGSSFLKDTPVGIIVLGDKSQTDLWRENCTISAIYMQIAAEAMGLGSCWVHVNGRLRDRNAPGGETAEEYLRTQVDIPSDTAVMCIVALGYPAREALPHALSDDADKVEWIG